MPSVSGPQHRAMAAAAKGESTLGIPKSVGEEFLQADTGHHFSDTRTAMKHHGVHRGDGEHKRHPATDHYSAGPQGHRVGRRIRNI
jgi:hypothetical protein